MGTNLKLKQTLPNNTTLNHIKLNDRHNRRLNYLRISITDRCNLRCRYCVPHNLIPTLVHGDILRYEEILRVVRTGVRLGINKVRVTGGEPLVRKGVYDFLDRLCRIEGLEDVSLTTNGVLLKENIQTIKSAGIKRLNISLDSLNRDKFYKITGHDYFNQVHEGIFAALEAGMNPVKINIVALNGFNDDEITDFADLSISYPFHIRFIEHMPIGTADIKIDTPLLAPKIKKILKEKGKLVPVEHQENDGPAERFKFQGSKGEIGLISALSHHFCDTCNRLRLTADGQLRSCLLSDQQEDLRGLLRRGGSDKDITEIFIKAVQNKPSGHQIKSGRPNPDKITGQMSSIGG